MSEFDNNVDNDDFYEEPEKEPEQPEADEKDDYLESQGMDRE